MTRERRGTQDVLAYIVYSGFGAFITLFILAIAAALMSIPNYGAKLSGQDCDCKVPAELILYVDAGGLMLGLGLLTPTLLFTAASIYLLAKRRRWVRSSTYTLILGVIIAVSIASTLLLSNQQQENAEPRFYAVNPYSLTVRLLNGSIFNTDALIGKVVVAEFFLPSCPACMVQLQELEKVYRSGIDVVYLLIVPSWNHIDLEDLRGYAQNLHEHILIGFDEGSATKDYGVDAVPTIVFLSADRSSALIHIGLAKQAMMEEILARWDVLNLEQSRKRLLSLEEAAEHEGRVIVYVEDYLEVDLAQRLAEGFRQKYPNISVIILWPECCGPSKNVRSADIITGSDMVVLENLKAEGLLRAPNEEITYRFPDWAKDREGFWFAQGLKIEIPAYNKALLDRPPSSLLEAAKWCNHAVIAKPDRTIRDAPFIALATLYGAEYWRILQNSSVMLVPQLRVAEVLASGERALTLFLPLKEYFRARSLSPDVHYFVPEEGIFVRPSWIALASDSLHPNAGELWLRYVLSEEGQRLRESVYHEPSARLDIERRQDFVDLMREVDAGKIIQPDWSLYLVDPQRYRTFFNFLGI